MKTKVLCPRCGEIRTKYIKCSNLCQSCYRKLLDKYCFFNYKENIKIRSGSNIDKICTYVVKYNLRPKEIVESYGNILHIGNINYVNTIINRFLYRCDTYGNKRPDYMEKIIDE